MRKVPALTAHSRGIRHNPPADAMPAPSKLTSTWILLPEQSGVDRSRQKAHTNTAREEAQSLPAAETVWCRSPAERRHKASRLLKRCGVVALPRAARQRQTRGLQSRMRKEPVIAEGALLIVASTTVPLCRYRPRRARLSKPSQTPSVPCSASEVTVAAPRSSCITNRDELCPGGASGGSRTDGRAA